VPWAAENGIVLDHDADVPLGVQIDWGIRTAVAAGRLRPGERLPALRDLATELGVNHNTLRAAVGKLEREGVLESRHGSGTFVADGAPSDARHAPVLDEVVRLAADAGLSPRALATALYLTEEPARRDDPEVAERRALRDEIAVLDRLVVQLEERLTTQHVPPEPRRARGGRLLSVEDLREERDALVRRLAAVQRVLDGPPPEDDASAERAPAKSPARAPRRAPRPRPAT
jgi:DNA-binding transcriptional regulator YhcF (GntR family)